MIGLEPITGGHIVPLSTILMTYIPHKTSETAEVPDQKSLLKSFKVQPKDICLICNLTCQSVQEGRFKLTL